MPAEIHKQVLDYQGGDANAALELVEKFKPLIKRYAFFLHREDSFEDLQRFLLSMLKTWDTSRLSSTDDATVTRYIANSVKNEYIALSKQKAKERGTSYLEDATLPQALEYAQKTSTCDQYDQLTLQRCALSKLCVFDRAHLCSLHLNGSTVLYRAGLSYSHSIVRYTNFDKRLSFH